MARLKDMGARGGCRRAEGLRDGIRHEYERVHVTYHARPLSQLIEDLLFFDRSTAQSGTDVFFHLHRIIQENYD